MYNHNKFVIALFSVICILFIGYVALGPAKMVPRTGLGWQADHFTGYFGFTALLCSAWRRIFAVGGWVTSFALALELFQGLTPDRHPDVMGAFYSVSGVLCATLLADLFTRSGNHSLIPFLKRA
jgi:hypothetical protein